MEGGLWGWEAVEDANGEGSGGEVEAVRVVVEVGEEVVNELRVLVKGGESGREEGRGELWGNVFDEMPLRRFDGIEECGLGDWNWWWDWGRSGKRERPCLGMAVGE